MTDKTLFQVNFNGGLGLESDDMSNQKLTTASNVIYEFKGGLARRYGTSTVKNYVSTTDLVDPSTLEPSKNLFDSSTLSPSIETTSHMCSYRNKLIRLSESKLYGDAFTYVDLLPNTVAKYDILATATDSLTACDSIEARPYDWIDLKVVLYRSEAKTGLATNYWINYTNFYYDIYVNGNLFLSKQVVNVWGKSSHAKLVKTKYHVFLVFDDQDSDSLYYRVMDGGVPESGFSSRISLPIKYKYNISTSTYATGGVYRYTSGATTDVLFDVQPYSMSDADTRTFLISYVVAETVGSTTSYYSEVQKVVSTATSVSGGWTYAYDNTNSILLWVGTGKTAETYPVTAISLCSDVSTTNQSPYVWLTYGYTDSSTEYAYVKTVPIVKTGTPASNPYPSPVTVVYTNSTNINNIGYVRHVVSVNKAAAQSNPADTTTVGHTAYIAVSLLLRNPFSFDATTFRGLLSCTRCEVQTLTVGSQAIIKASIAQSHLTWDCPAIFLCRPWIYNDTPYVSALIGKESGHVSSGDSHVVLDLMLGPQRMRWGRFDVPHVRPVCNVLPRQVGYVDIAKAIEWTNPVPRGSVSNTTVSGSTVRYVCNISNSPTYWSGTSSVGQFQIDHSFLRSSTQGNGSLLIAGGVPCKYDALGISEMGYIRSPAIIGASATASTGGEPGTGTHYYKAIYEWTDANGLVCRSESSDAVAVSKTAYINQIGVCFNQLTSRLDLTANDITWSNDLSGINPIKIGIYRSTLDSDANYYRVCTLPIPKNFNDVTAGLSAPPMLKFSDNVTDETLITHELLYEADGTILGNVSPPSASVVCTHKSRFWLAGTPDDTIWYSKTFVQFQEPGFNEVLTIAPFEGGRVVGLASLDDYLVIFKENSVWLLQGDGHDASGTGSTLQTPIKISEGTGCTSPGSIVVAEDSVFFQSNDGIYRLRRGTNQLECISDGIRVYTTSYYNKYNIRVTSATYVQRDSTLRFAFTGTTTPSSGSDESPIIYNGEYFPVTTKFLAVYNLDFGAWTTFTYTRNNTGYYNYKVTVATQCIHDGTWYGCDSTNRIFKEILTSKNDDDDTSIFRCALSTGIMHVSEMAGFHRIQRVILNAKRVGSSDGYLRYLIMSFSPNTYSTGYRYFQPIASSALVKTEYLELPVVYQKSDSIQIFLMWEPNATNSASLGYPPIGNGDTIRITGVTVYGNPMRGKARKAASISRKYTP